MGFKTFSEGGGYGQRLQVMKKKSLAALTPPLISILLFTQNYFRRLTPVFKNCLENYVDIFELELLLILHILLFNVLSYIF